MSDYRKLSNQPLQLALTEVRFSPVMEIAKYIPLVQDKIRAKYPIFGPPSTERSVHIEGQKIEMRESHRWSFVSKNRKSAISLGEGGIVYFTTEYPRFTQFAEIVEEVLLIIQDVISPSLVSRIGIRFCDLVKPEGEERLEQLVSEDILSPKAVLRHGEIAQHKTETITIGEAGTLIFRTLSGNNNGVLPPDLGNIPVTIVGDKETSVRAILDFDNFWQDEQNQMDFDTNAIVGKLQALHDSAREAFWAITTDYARNVKWN